MKKVIDRFSAIKAENKELVSDMIQKAVKNGDTVYGELSDWIRDYHNDLSLLERELLCKMLLGDMVIHHPERISTEIKVLYAVDSEDNTEQAICATSEANWQDGSKREAIDKAVRDFLGDILTEYIEDPYEAHINDKSEDEKKAEFAETINKLASGQDSEFLWYELFWRSVPTL